MASSVSHQDTERAGVGVTAHGVSALRHYERATRGPHGDALINDPFAERLSGEIGSRWVDSLEPWRKTGMIDGLAVRTRRIDDDITAAINVRGKDTLSESDKFQVVVLGAGLDSRPWRLSEQIKYATNWFEVDFPEIFDYKLPIVASGSSNTDSTITHIRVDADLSIPTWISKLVDRGYHPSMPSIWLLEVHVTSVLEKPKNLM
jgi:methyltransferase (TIGR00027 family)